MQARGFPLHERSPSLPGADFLFTILTNLAFVKNKMRLHQVAQASALEVCGTSPDSCSQTRGQASFFENHLMGAVKTRTPGTGIRATRSNF